ncbi:MAG TPA: alkaline phosphatase family protein [Gemmatimonadaceae bacterium]|nr:alkaline phosphatase family protein [Gemmatimonadaceae bacterium]
MLSPSPPPPPPPPPPLPPSGTLDHIIVVTMENRSFDHLLGWVPGADGKQAGLSYLDTSGVPRSTHHLTEFESCTFADPNHSFSGGRQNYNNGGCDGWLRTDGNDIYAIGYFLGTDLPFLGKAAAEWLVLDRYFCPILGPTFPNRVISLAGQTDRLANTLVPSTLPTIWDRLSAEGKTGLNYGTALTSSTLWGTRYLSLIRPINQFFADAAAGTLPNVSFVDPELADTVTNSYHPPGDIRNAEAFLASIYKAVTTSPLWNKSLLIITFDEWGGFFDHVPPPVAPIPQIERDIGNTDGLRGFRVPTVLVSPFVKRRSVSSRIYDHASVLKLIETRWNLPPLTVRDAEALNLMDEINLNTPVTAAPSFDVAPGPYGSRCGRA